VRVRTFPNNIFAGMLGFQPRQGFTADPGSQNAPRVEFPDQQSRTPSVSFDSTSR
jgi:LemA protein